MPLCNYTHYQVSSDNFIVSTGLSPYECLLQSDIKFTIEEVGDSYQAYLHNHIWVDKKIPVGPSYTKEWGKQGMLKDLAIKIITRWGYSIQKVGW